MHFSWDYFETDYELRNLKPLQPFFPRRYYHYYVLGLKVASLASRQVRLEDY